MLIFTRVAALRGKYLSGTSLPALHGIVTSFLIYLLVIKEAMGKSVKTLQLIFFGDSWVQDMNQS